MRNRCNIMFINTRRNDYNTIWFVTKNVIINIIEIKSEFTFLLGMRPERFVQNHIIICGPPRKKIKESCLRWSEGFG